MLTYYFIISSVNIFSLTYKFSTNKCLDKAVQMPGACFPNGALYVYFVFFGLLIYHCFN